MLKATFHVYLATTFFLSFAGATLADGLGESLKARGGQVRCGGNHFLRVNNSESHTTNYELANIDPTEPIIINGLRVYDARGTVIYDSAILGLPQSLNLLISSGNNTLNPNQSATIVTETSFLPDFLGQTVRPIQVVIDWSSARRALPLIVRASLKSREHNSITGFDAAERSRSDVWCVSTLRNRD